MKFERGPFHRDKHIHDLAVARACLHLLFGALTTFRRAFFRST